MSQDTSRSWRTLWSFPSPRTPSDLWRLYILRNVALGGQIVAIAWVQFGLDMALPLVPMGSIVATLALFNMLTRWRLTRPLPVTQVETFVQLLVDVAALTGLLYLSGGAANPFVSLYLLPLVIVAISLPFAYTIAMASITAAFYTMLMRYAVPLPAGASMQNDFHLHLLGMWLNFMVSATLIVFFVTRMARAIRERDRLLAEAREESLRNERIVALGTLAAGTAHELGTPLASVAVIGKELEHEHADRPQLIEDLRCLREQVDLCKASLARLTACSGQAGETDAPILSVDAYSKSMQERWRLMRPTVPMTVRLEGAHPCPTVVAQETVTQTLTSLVNNAADASPSGIEVKWDWDDSRLTIEILDRGPGITPAVARRATEAFFTTKAPGRGLGLGLFLANATIERLGGKVHLFNRADGGANTQVTLPLARLVATG